MRQRVSAVGWIWRAALVVVNCLLLLAAHTWFAAPLRLDWLFSRFVVEERWADPDQMSMQPNLWSWLRDADSALTPLSPQSREDSLARSRRYLATLDNYDCKDYDFEERQSCEVFGYLLDQHIEAQRWRNYEHPLNPVFGVQNTLPQLLQASAATVDGPQAGRAFLARLRVVQPTVDGWLRVLREQQAAGVLPPKSMVAAVLEDLRGFVATTPDAHPILAGLGAQFGRLSPAVLPVPIREALMRDAATAMDTSVYPAWRALIDHFTQLQALPLSDDGAWSQPEGDDYYRFAVRQHTTSDLSPDEIHQLGLDEAIRVGSQLDAELGRVGLEAGPLGERLTALGRQPSQRLDESSRMEVIAEFRQMLDRAEVASRGAFVNLPEAKLDVRVVPESRQRSAPGAYYMPSPALGEPAAIFLNLRALDELPRYSLRTLAHHEGVPGHHLQSAWLQRSQSLPMFRHRLAYSAYAEGWAMYAEQLAAELGLNVSVEDRIGYLQSELFRAARLVVDTGLHRKHWSSERAIAYLQTEVGLGPADARAEVERYLVYPGQALAFQIGLLRFRALRQTARAQLREKFDLAEFHAMLLDGGRLPLDLLDRRVERWIEMRAVDTR